MNFIRNFFLPPLIAGLYWIWSSTWKLKLKTHPLFEEACRNGSVIFAHWHGDEMVVVKLGPKYNGAAMTSTSKDGELMTRVLKIFGFGLSRGSSTRGGARALLGMVHLMKEGYNATVAVDGPKGPRHKVKPGVWAIAKHSGAPIIPVGVDHSAGLKFEKSWNKTFFPWPFSKVAVSFGEPIFLESHQNLSEPALCELLENKLQEEHQMAKKILSLGTALILCLFLGACASSPQSGNSNSQEGTLGALSKTVHSQLKPKAKIVSGQEPPTIKFVQPQGLAQKYGFKVGDYILKVNGKEISSSLEFEKKLKLPPSLMEIEYKTKNAVNTKRVAFASETTRFGASTEIQNTPIVKSTSPAIAIINRGPVSIYCSSSVNDQKDTLFVNTIIDSEITKLKAPLTVTVLEKKSKKEVGSSKETIDAVSLKSVLVSKKFSISRVPQEGLIVQIALDSQQFIFEFHE